MDISRLMIQNQALAAQMFGAQTGANGLKVGGVQEPVNRTQVGAIGTEDASSAKFNWRNLNNFDNFLTTSTPQTGVVTTNEQPTEVGGVNPFAAGKTGAQTQAGQVDGNAGLFASLSAIDAKDIGLNGDRNGFQGQSKINFLA